jgi:hypothetical protein
MFRTGRVELVVMALALVTVSGAGAQEPTE